MFVSECFYSLQGEGELVGVPSVFIRTSGCNLHCRWCDTTYASWEGAGENVSIDELVLKVAEYPTNYCVITGGEPMLASGIHELTRTLISRGKHVTIETAATIPPNGISCSLASLSPKLSNSTPRDEVSDSIRLKHDSLRIQLDVLREWIEQYDYQLKFVICNDSDIIELIALLKEIDRPISPAKVLLMPEGVSSEAFLKVNDTIISACKHYGFRYCDRLHIKLFGNKRES